MTCIIVLCAALLSSPAHAEWCSGIITSNGTCIGSQGNTDPPIMDCDDYGRCGVFGVDVRRFP